MMPINMFSALTGERHMKSFGQMFNRIDESTTKPKQLSNAEIDDLIKNVALMPNVDAAYKLAAVKALKDLKK